MFKASVVFCGLIAFPAVISGKCLVLPVPVLGSLLFYCHSDLSGLYVHHTGGLYTDDSVGSLIHVLNALVCE